LFFFCFLLLLFFIFIYYLFVFFFDLFKKRPSTKLGQVQQGG